ncbi:MAG TPA: hypothetical protein VHR45_14935 [Thermoanaerobaculia bacterium]|nr:hypothetical protein [Thermoanaerobaculia bacterium]
MAKLVLAGLAVVLFYVSVRIAAPAPWSYDEYYHLGVARELRSHFPLRSFPWTPFSLLSDRFADGTPLFHLLLMPFAALPIERAGLAGVVLSQLFLVGCFAWVLWRLRVPSAYVYLLGLATLGSMFAMRFDMCRPHLLLIGFSVLLLGLLVSGGRPLALFVSSALFGLAHAGGWIGIAYAGAWALAGHLTTARTTSTVEARRFVWRPMAWIAAGWVCGQLLHPNFPQNLRLLGLVNLVIPFQASPAGNLALRSQIGEELTAPGLGIVAEQWPIFLAPGLVLLTLLREPRLRTRATMTSALLAAGFLLLGSLMLRRFLELGAPLGILALAVLAAERQRQGRGGVLGGWGPWIAPLALLVGGLWTSATVRSYGFGSVSPPQEMARWLGENGKRGERVFTAQWADAAPLFYAAPQLQSLVALDPTLFYARDPALFQEYVDLVQGRRPAPAAEVRGRFGARYVTLWRVPVFQRFAEELLAEAGVKTVYSDRYYLVLDLAPR